MLGGVRRFASLDEAMAGYSGRRRDVVAARARASTRLLELAGAARASSRRLGEAARVAFVFGPERSGLTEEELARASRLPAAADRPGVPDDEPLARGRGRARPSARRSRAPAAARATRGPELAPGRRDRGAPSAHWDRALEAIDFYDTGHRDRSLRDWRRLVAARPLTTREVAILRGVANRVLVSLRRSAATDGSGC